MLIARSALLVFLLSSVALAQLDYGAEDTAPWIENPLVWDKCFVDLSDLNHKPAGKFGRVVARGDKFVFESTGEVCRFWSTNLGGQACFGPEDDVQGKAYLTTMADRLAALGFNHVRLHHTDNKPNPNTPGGIWQHWSGPSMVDYSQEGTVRLNAKSVDRLDFLIAELKRRGIYVYVDFFNLREFDEHDGIRDFQEMQKVSKNKYAFHVDEDIQKNMKEFIVLLGNHKNPYTGLTWGEEPAICMATLANENDFTFFTTSNLLKNETDRSKTKGVAEKFVQEGKLSIDPSKAVVFDTADHNRFAAFLEQQVYSDFIRTAREAGWRAMISSGNWCYRGPVSVIGKARSGDFLDNHAYQSETCYLFDDPTFARHIYAKLAVAHVAHKPFVVSEWQTGRMATKQMHLPHRATSVIASAAYGAHQGWDGVSFFSYGQPHNQAERAGGNYDAYLDQAHMGVMPASALIYRRDVTESTKPVVVMMSDEDVYASNRYNKWNTAKPDESGVPTAFLTAFEKHKTVVGFTPDFLPNPGDISVTSDQHKRNFLESDRQVTTDNGQISRDWKAGWHLIDTPGSQVAQGFYGGTVLKTRDVTFSPENKYAVIAVSSLTQEPIKSSRRMLVTAMGVSYRQPGREENYRSQCLKGTITIKFEKPPKSARLVPVGGDGVRQEAIALNVAEDGSVAVDLLSAQTHWYEVEATW